MPDLRQSLKDFVATANSGKYSDEATLLSKFPELKGYDINALKDFVATANSGKYINEDELFSKFPEFNISGLKDTSKKKADTVLPSGGGSLVSPRIEPQRPAAESTAIKSIAPIPTVKKEKKEEIGTALNVVGAFNKGVLNLFGQGAKAVGTAMQGITSKITGDDGRGFISDALINVGDKYLKAIEELNPQDEEFKGTITDQFTQGLGQVVGTVLTAGVGRVGAAASAIQAAPKAVTLGTAAKQLASTIASPAGAISALNMGQSEFDRAKEAGATDEQAFEAFYKNAITGSALETIPVMQFFKRFNNATAGGLVNYLKTKAIGGITGGIEEMTTEVLQQLYANKTAQDIYNVNQNLFEGVGESGGIGFGIGFLLNAMGTNAKLLRKEGKNDEADILEAQMKEFEAKQDQQDAPPPAPPAVYKMKGLPIVTKDVIENIIDNAPVPEIINLGIEIDNDTELSDKLQKRIVTHSIKEQVRQGNPDLNEPSLNAITELELELKKLEGNTTQTGKDKAAAIRQQIKNIQENQLQEEAVAETVEAEAPEVAQKRVDRIAEIESIISNDDATFAETGQRPLLNEARVELQTELETLKTEQDAIQKQATSQVPLQPTTGSSQEMAQGEPQAEPQVVTAEGIQETITPEGRTQEIIIGSTVKWDVFGNEEMGDWTIKDETTTREGKPAVTLSKIYVQDRTNGKTYTKEYADKNEIKYDNEFTVEHILPINELKPIQPEVSSKTQAPKFVRDISALITPATVRGFSPLTKRIKKLSLNYDKLVKQYAKKKDPKVLAKIKEAENQILNDAKQEIIDAVAKVDGVAVKFSEPKRGLWDGSFEPSFNMILSISPQADTKKVSDLLFDFAEKYSQDAFILESESEFEEDVFNDKREMPLTEFDENNLMHYPQIIYTFAEPITDEQVAELSVALENEGIDAFNINNNELQVSVIKFLSEEEQNNLTNDEQYEERTRDFDSKAVATAKATSDVLGSDGKGTSSIRIKKSSYQGATNEGTADQTRQFNRSDIFEAFKGSTTKVETLAVELADLRQKEIDLQKEGKKLSPEDQARFNELNKKIQPVVQRTFEANKKLYEDAKTEVERIAQDAIADVDASISPFPIKRAERASVKAIRWYNAFTEKLGDAARVNIVVDTDANADKVFEIIDKKYPGDKEVRRITETTDLGYPKRLIEIRTSNGTIAEIQVITNEAYLAKDGIKGFTGNQKQKSKAKQKLDAVRARLGWNIPDGLGHYFYEIQRDTNVDEDLRDEAARLSDLYYDAFTNPKSALTESFMKDVKAFKKNVDAANKSQWDAGNTGKAPQSLIDYKPTKVKTEAKKPKAATKAEQIVEEGAPTAEDLSSIDALLDLDVENEDNMLTVLNALDNLDKKISKRLFGGANESLLAIPLGTVQLVVKTLKALVKGGMKLRDAIKKVAADNNLSQDIIKDIINISPLQEDFNALMSKVDELIARQKRRGIEDAKIVRNLDTFIRNSDAYKNANDAQKKIMEREGRIKMGVEQRRAPSIGRILGVLKDITNVSRKDKLKIISQIRQLSKDAAKDLAKEIRDLASTGKITVNQAANIIARFGKVNMLSEISVSSFVNYMTNVFSDAEYASKLSAAKSLKSSIASLSKNKEKNADLRELAKQFIEIDPSMVDDIDAYNDMASKIKEAISGSSIKSPNVNLARTVDIESSLEYISKTLEAQDKLMREVKAAEIQQLMGIDVSEFSYDDMVELLKKDKQPTKYNEGIVRSTINKMFNVFSAMISENIKNNEDPITGEKIDYTKEEKRIITEFMDMDLSLLEPKQALEAVDALANFLQNKSTAKMGAMLAEYKGIVGTQTAVKKNLKAQTLKKYGLEWLGKLLAENTTNLNVLFERMFKGFGKGNMIQKLMGIKDVINNKASALKESSNKVEDYVQKFYKKLANGEAFNTAYNNVERGISSFMQRTIIGSESQKREFFNTRKKLIKQSIEVLSQGNDKEKEKAKLYQQAYDKLIGQTKGPNENQILENEAGSIEDIRRRTDATNLDAINYWQNSWSEKYDQLYNTALNIYNKVLGRDINYTPDRYSKLSSDTGQVELANDQSAFLNNNDVLYQKEAGVLMETTRPDSLPKGKYLDFAFDNNNSNSYYEALVDMATAEPIRQVQGFLNSPLYKKVVPNSDDATILKDRIQLFINNFRNKNPYDNDEFSKFVRSLNVLAEIGASMALGGVTQPIKQVVPVAVNTLVNAGNLDLSAPFDKAKNDFMSKSGYGIANRGVESQAQVQSMNKLVEEAAKSSPQKLFNLLKKGNQLYLKLFLVNADAYIARASWMTYYEKYLNDKGVNTKGIDYNTHKLNKDAADYAQSMVDRQQNVSDADLSGKMFSSKLPAVQLIVKAVMPFASFRMNQASRVGSDIAVVTDKTATEEDKTIAIRSLMGYAAETVTFRLISGYIAYQLGTAALKLLDREESEEEKEKRKNNLIKGQVTGTVTDVLSPAPIADKFVQSKVNDLVGAVQTGMNIPLEKQYNIFGESKQDYVQNMGMYGIASERASQLFELSQLAATGKYTDDFGKEKTISEKDQETLKPFIGLGFLSSIGLAPSETGSILRYMVKNVKKAPGKTAEEIEATEERLEEKQENKEQKIEALENLRRRTRFKKQLDIINEKIDELEATPEEKKVIQQEKKEERQRKEELLTDPRTGVKYDNETELKRYNPRLYNKNFGLRSQWFKDHKDEKQVEEKLGKELRKMEDKEYKYVRRNSDGSLKRTGN